MCDSKSNQGEMQGHQHSLIVRVVSSVLDKLICGHVDSPRRSSCGGFLKFQSSYAPDVTIEAYLERIRRYSRCSDACFVMALVYIDRLIESRGLILTTLNVHRLLITSVMLAAKFHDDLFYNNAYYSKLGGLSLTELNHLESDLLHHLDFSLFVSEVAYCRYSMQLQNYVFYLEVVPAPHAAAVPGQAVVQASAAAELSRSASPCCPVFVSSIACSALYAPQAPCGAYGAAPVQTPCPPPRAPLSLVPPVSTPTPAACHLSGAYFQYDAPLSGVASSAGWLRIPSPDNPHAKAGTFSDYHLTANSPLRMAPARSYQQQQLQAQVQANLLAQQQLYAASYSAAEIETDQQLQNMSPMIYPSGSMETPGFARSTSSGPGYFQGYTTGASLRDSCDESSTTTCSTRTTSPYPTSLYARSFSAGTLSGVGGLPAQAQLYGSAQPAVYAGGCSVYTAPVSSTWGAVDVPKRCASPQPGGHRSGLTIQTDLGCDGGYTLGRVDSGVSVTSTTTPYAVYEHPQIQRQVSYPAQRPSPSSYGTDYRSQLFAQSSQGVAYHSPMGYVANCSQQCQQALSAQSLYRQDCEQQLAMRYEPYVARQGGVYPGYSCAASSACTSHAEPRVVTPQLTPSRYHQQVQQHSQHHVKQQVYGARMGSNSSSEEWAAYGMHGYYHAGSNNMVSADVM